MSKARKQAEQVHEDPANGGPLPGKQVATTSAPATPAKVDEDEGPKFQQVPLSDSKYQRGFQRFNAEGETFVGWFDRCISRHEDDAVGKYDAISMFRYPDGSPTLLPGNLQLWEFFNDVVSQGDDPERERHLFSVTLVERVPDPDKEGEAKFLRFVFGEEKREKFLRPAHLKG